MIPIIALAGMLTNTGRVFAFLRPSTGAALAGACRRMPPCLVTAYGYTLLTGKGVQLVIGTMLILTVPLRYMLRGAPSCSATADWCWRRPVMVRPWAAPSVRA